MHAVAVLVAVGAVCYLLPTWIAIARRHHWVVRIALVNIALGWTIVGWVVAFHMSSTSRTRVAAYWRPAAPASSPQNFVPRAVDEGGRREPGPGA